MEEKLIQVQLCSSEMNDDVTDGGTDYLEMTTDDDQAAAAVAAVVSPVDDFLCLNSMNFVLNFSIDLLQMPPLLSVQLMTTVASAAAVAVAAAAAAGYFEIVYCNAVKHSNVQVF